jgi:hypothetical protein
VRKRLAALVALVAATTAGCASAAGATSGAGQNALRTSQARHTVTLAADALATGRLHRATLAIVSGAATVTVTAAVMPGKLLRASTPADSDVRPELVRSAGRVELFLGGAAGGRPGGGPSAVTVELNEATSWQLQFSGGASQTILDLRNAKVAGIDFTAGSSLIQMLLPRPAGTATITLAGGASQVSMAVPAGVPARLQLDGGASTATLAGLTHTGIAGGTVLTGPGWAHAVKRYDVFAPAGVSDIAVAGGTQGPAARK